MMEVDKLNMSLDDIIRAKHNERGRSRSRSCSHSRSDSHSCNRGAYRGQQWRLERGRQQHVTDDKPPRSRSRSQDSYRSNSQTPSLLSVPYIPPRHRSLPHQNYSFRDKQPFPAQRMGLRSGLGVNIRKRNLGFSAWSSSIFRPSSSLHQLRLAKKRVQIAKNILNARHQSYLRQLRQYRHEMLEDSFQMPQYALKNIQAFPGTFSEIWDRNKFLRHRIGTQRVYSPEGILSVTFENELANTQSHTNTAEGDTVPLSFKPSEVLTAPPHTIINGCLIRNPSVEKVINNDGVYMSTNGNERHTVATHCTDSLPVLVSSSEFPRLVYKPNECKMDQKRLIHPANKIQTLDQRFSNYRVVHL